ncbi:transposase [Singulisphaera rosea]
MGSRRTFLPREAGGGRPRKTDPRYVLDATLYILRYGCQWRYIPGALPSKNTL